MGRVDRTDGRDEFMKTEGTSVNERKESTTIDDRLPYDPASYRKAMENLHDALGDAVITIELPHYTIVEANRSIETLLGYRPDECKNQCATLFFADEGQLGLLVRKLKKTRSPERANLLVEVHLKHKNGGLFKARMTASILAESKGSSRLILLIRNHSIRPQTDEELQAVHGRESAILRALPDLLLLQDDQGVYVDCYAAEPDILPSTPDHILGKTIPDAMPPVIAGHLEPLLKKVQETRTIEFAEYAITRQGEIRHYEARMAPCGESHTLTIIRDITTQRRLEERIVQVQKLEAMGRLAGGIAHDFNNLLTVVLGNSDLLLREISPRDSKKKLVEEIMNVAIRASRLTHHLLAYSGKGPIHLAPVEPATVIRETIGLLREAIPSHVTVSLRLPDGLPAVKGDYTQIQQVLMHLLNNAVEAIGANKGRIIVSAGTRKLKQKYLARHEMGESLKEGDYLYISVSDSGPGVCDADVKKIFDPFFTTKHDRPGRGLGLAASLGIIRSFQGFFQVTRRLPSGLTFTAYLSPAELDQIAGAIGRVTPGLRSTTKERLSVLVVDDEDSVRITTRLLLETHGFKTLAASNGAMGLSSLEENIKTISAVLLDLTMPDLNGRETYYRMRKLSRDIPILFYSGYSEEEVAELLVEDKKTGFLQKPFTTQDLINHLTALLQ